MRGIIGGFVVGLLTATMTQGDYEFDKTVQDYVNDAMKKLKKFTEDLPTNKSVVIRDFVRASIEFSKLQCTLPRVDDIAIYVLSVGANGKIYFRVYKDNGNVQKLMLIIPRFHYSLVQKDPKTNEDFIGTPPTVPRIYDPTGHNINGTYSDYLRYYLTQGQFFTFLKKAFTGKVNIESKP
ncbi:hypothetical protein MTO96_007111 [Rhipicephalus appendiculatus]